MRNAAPWVRSSMGRRLNMLRARVTVLLDPEVDERRLLSRRGPLVEWFDVYVIESLRRLGHTVSVVVFDYELHQCLDCIVKTRPDIVFNLMTPGANGDSRDVAMVFALETLGIAYTGSSAATLQITNNKALAKRIVRDAGLHTPRFFVARPTDTVPEKADFAYPMIVKPVAAGASVGLSLGAVVRSPRTLQARITAIHESLYQSALCEEFVEGREVTVAVFGHPKLRVLPPVEWRFDGSQNGSPDFFTYRAKWDKMYRKAHKIRPVRLRRASELATKVAETTLRISDLLGLRDYGRIDFRIGRDGALKFIEANSNPGLWPDSLGFGKVRFSLLVQGLVEFAMARAIDGTV